mmetsp:Transcript_9799/g.26667  ORF Transcript_9799/g.26667 Transcript_9799/m.26667 type:complete len:286 (-) Transcript_9799:420-1277(-)
MAAAIRAPSVSMASTAGRICSAVDRALHQSPAKKVSRGISSPARCLSNNFLRSSSSQKFSRGTYTSGVRLERHSDTVPYPIFPITTSAIATKSGTYAFGGTRRTFGGKSSPRASPSIDAVTKNNQEEDGEEAFASPIVCQSKSTPRECPPVISKQTLASSSILSRERIASRPSRIGRAISGTSTAIDSKDRGPNTENPANRRNPSACPTISSSLPTTDRNAPSSSPSRINGRYIKPQEKLVISTTGTPACLAAGNANPTTSDTTTSGLDSRSHLTSSAISMSISR